MLSPVKGDDNPNWRPDNFQVELWGSQTSFRFSTVKLLDYRLEWDALENSDNPFATVVMAHLKTLETKHDAFERQRWKLNLAKRLYQKGYNRQDVINLLRFIDWLINLPEVLEQSFWQSLLTFQEEQRMQYVMSIERFAEKRGIEQGIERERSLILRLLARKLGDLPDEIPAQVGELSLNQLEDLGEALLDFAELVDLENWLGRLQTLKGEVVQQLDARLGELDKGIIEQFQGVSLSSLSGLKKEIANFGGMSDLLDWLEGQR